MITKFSFCTVSIIAKGLVKDYSDHQVIIFTTSEFVDPRRLGMYSRHRVYYYDTEDKVIVNTKLVGGYFFADLKDSIHPEYEENQRYDIFKDDRKFREAVEPYLVDEHVSAQFIVDEEYNVLNYESHKVRIEDFMEEQRRNENNSN